MPGYLPRVATPDFSHVGDSFEGLRLPTGSSNPWTLGNDWFQRNVLGNEPTRPSDGINYRGDDLRRFTPEYVHDNAQHLGMSEHTPDRDFLNEFVAHSVTGESDESPAIGPNERRSVHVARMHALEQQETLTEEEMVELDRWNQESQMLRSWGMNPEIGAENEVYDERTGLYAVRYDPLAEGDENYDPNARSITSFAGTHSTNDLRSDADTEVGCTQYDPNREAISALIRGGTEGGTLTGHSLGGYLGQRAAVDNADHIGEVVTFQSGGLDHEHADAFERNRGNVQVRHHSSDQDFVHLGGEQRLSGRTFHHHSDDGQFGHTSNLMAGTDGEVLRDAGVDEGTTEGWDGQDRRIIEMGRRTAATARHALGATFDPGYYMAEDAVAGARSLGGHVGNAADTARSGSGQAVDHAMGAGRRALDAATDLDATRTLDALAAGGTQVVGDVARTGGALVDEASSTFSELSDGAGRSLHRAGARASQQGAAFVEDLRSQTETGMAFGQEATDRAAQWSRAGMDAAGEAGHAVWDAGVETAGNVADSAAQVWHSLWD